MHKSFFLMLILSLTGMLQAQELRYEDHTYLEHIKSVQFSIEDLVTSEPIVDLTSPAKLTLSFDDILGGDRDYTYKIIHCSKDWQPSDITEMDYMVGFNDEEFEVFEYSTGTKIDYTNYKLTLPNDDTGWRLSGNYLLVVTDDESDEIALSRRFIVAESLVSIGATIERSVKTNRLSLNQDLQLTIDNTRYPISNPLNDIFVTIMQNGRWDNALYNLSPKFVVGNVLNFDRTNRPSFPAYNVFRGVDLRTIRSRGYGVHSIEIYEDEINVLLQLEKRRGNVIFQDYNDLNGGFIIENRESLSGNSDLTSEYVETIFTFDYSQRILDGDIYVIGPFTDWQLKDEFRLGYDAKNEIYAGGTLLKQGYYDYQYCIGYDDGTVDIEALEGGTFTTGNNYHIIVYHRDMGSRYDRVIGVTSVSSNFGR